MCVAQVHDIVFSCEYMIEYDNAVRTIALLYRMDEHKWFIIEPE